MLHTNFDRFSDMVHEAHNTQQTSTGKLINKEQLLTKEYAP